MSDEEPPKEEEPKEEEPKEEEPKEEEEKDDDEEENKNKSGDDDNSESEEEPPKKKSSGGKYWDEDDIEDFRDKMEDEIMEIVKDIDSYTDQASEVSAAIEQILDKSQDKLEASNKKDYKYWSNCLIFDIKTVYRKHMKFYWEKAYDKMITIKVNTERLHVVLIAFAVYYG